MEILNENQAGQLEIKPSGFAGRVSKNASVYEQMASLQEGQTLLLRKEEWRGKTKILHSLGSKKLKALFADKRFHIFNLKDESGWLISLRKGN